MVSLATGSRGMSVKQQTLSVLFDLDFEGTKPVFQFKSHIIAKKCRLSDLRESS